MGVNRLTINLQDILGKELPDVPIGIRLAAPDRLTPDAGPPAQPGRLVPDTPEVVYSDADSVAIIDLPATVDYVRRNPYIITIPDYDTITLIMPDAPTALYDYLNAPASPLPARQLPDPASTPDGETVISLNSRWQTGRYLFYGATQPTDPSAGVFALWVDTSTVGRPQLRAWDGVDWVDADVAQIGEIITSALADGSVTADKLASDAVTRPKIADMAVGSAQIGVSAVGTTEIEDTAVTSAKLADDAVSDGKIAADVVGGRELAPRGIDASTLFADGVVGTDQIANQAITTDKLAVGAVIAGFIGLDAVGTQNIQNEAVTLAKMAHNSVGGDQIVAGAVDTAELASDAVTEAKLADDSVGPDQLAANAVGRPAIADNAVGTDEIANNAVTSAKINPGAVGTDEIAGAAITRTELADNAVGTDEVADDAVTAAKLAAGAVGTPALADDAVTRPKIAAAAVGTNEIADTAITNPKLADAAVNTQELANASITTQKLADDAVTGAKIAPGVITGQGTGADNHIAAGSIDTADLADNAVTEPKLAANAVATAKIAADAVTQAKLAANAVGASELANNAVDTNAIADRAVQRGKLADSAVGELQIGTDAVTTPKLEDAAVTTAKIADAAVTQAKLASGFVFPVADGSVTPAKLDADTQAKVAAFQRLLGINPPQDLEFHQIMMTVAIDPTSAPANDEGGFSESEYGQLDNQTFQLGGVSRVIRQISLDTDSSTRELTYTLSSQIIPPGDQGIYFVATNQAYYLKDAPRDTQGRAGTGTADYGDPNGWEYTWTYPSGSPPFPLTANAMVEIIVGGEEEIKFIQLLAQQLIDTAHIQDAAITTPKIADDAVTRAKIAPGAVGTAEIAALAVGGNQLADDAVVQAKIADNAVGTDQIATNAVTANELADGAVDAGALMSDSVVTGSIVDGSVTADKILDGGVTQAKVAAGAIDLDKLASAVSARLLPAGGADGEVLTKSSGSNYAVSWEAVSSAGGYEIDDIILAPTSYTSATAGTQSVSGSITLPATYANSDFLILTVEADRTSASGSNKVVTFRIPTDRIAATTGDGGNFDMILSDHAVGVNPSDIRVRWLSASARTVEVFSNRNNPANNTDFPSPRITSAWLESVSETTAASGGGAVGGQTGGAVVVPAVYVYLWKRAATAPNVSELAPGAPSSPSWSGRTWATTPTGWETRPDATTGNAQLYEAITTATYDEGTQAWVLGTWSIIPRDSFDIRYTTSANPDNDPGATITSTPSSSSRFWSTRQPDGTWGVWLPIAEPLAWTQLVRLNFNEISGTRTPITKTLPAPMNINDINFMRVTARNQTSAGVIEYIVMGYWTRDGWIAPTSRTTNFNNYETLLVVTTQGKMELAMTSEDVRSSVSVGSTLGFDTKLALRGTAPMISQFYFYQFATTGQHGFVNFEVM